MVEDVIEIEVEDEDEDEDETEKVITQGCTGKSAETRGGTFL